MPSVRFHNTDSGTVDNEWAIRPSLSVSVITAKIYLNFGMRLIVLSLKTQHRNIFIFIVYEKHVEVAFF